MNRRRHSLFPSPVLALDRSALGGQGAPAHFVVLAGALLALIIALAWRTIDSSQVLLHLKAGEQIIAARMVPKTDAFSAASSREGWVYIEWAWALVLGATHKAADWTGLSILNVVCIAATAGLLLMRARKRGARWFESLVVSGFVLGALVPTFQPGPQRIAAILFLLALMTGESRRLWPLVFLPLIMWLWANMHPAFLLVTLVPLARLIMPPRDAMADKSAGPTAYLVVILLTCLAASVITPYSLQTARAAFDTLVVTAGDSLRNWQQVFLAPNVLLRIAAVLILAITTTLSRSLVRRWEILAAVALLAGAIVSPSALDFLLLYLAAPAAVSLTQLMARSWNTAVVRQAAGVALTLAVLAITCGSLALGRLTTDAFGTGIRKNTFPEAAAGRLASLPLRNAILHDARDGGYIAWRVWPSWKITMDERGALYGDDMREQYDLLWQGAPGWDKILNHWRVYAVLGRPDIMVKFPQNNLLMQVAKSPEWKPVYWDSHSILYVRADVELGTSNLQQFRQLDPGLQWDALAAQMESADDWRELNADLRRVILEDPTNIAAHEHLRKAQEQAPEN